MESIEVVCLWVWMYLWYVSYRLLFGLPESLELLAYPASKVYKVGKRGGRDREQRDRDGEESEKGNRVPGTKKSGQDRTHGKRCLCQRG